MMRTRNQFSELFVNWISHYLECYTYEYEAILLRQLPYINVAIWQVSHFVFQVLFQSLLCENSACWYLVTEQFNLLQNSLHSVGTLACTVYLSVTQSGPAQSASDRGQALFLCRYLWGRDTALDVNAAQGEVKGHQQASATFILWMSSGDAYPEDPGFPMTHWQPNQRALTFEVSSHIRANTNKHLCDCRHTHTQRHTLYLSRCLCKSPW